MRLVMIVLLTSCSSDAEAPTVEAIEQTEEVVKDEAKGKAEAEETTKTEDEAEVDAEAETDKIEDEASE